jgi:branched-subunit amino acid transport protein
MHDLVILVVIAVATYLLRGVFLVSPALSPPPALRRVLTHVGPAVLAAIVAPQLFLIHGSASPRSVSAGVLAAIATGVLWRWRRNLPLALFGGLGAWWIAAMTVAV